VMPEVPMEAMDAGAPQGRRGGHTGAAGAKRPWRARGTAMESAGHREDEGAVTRAPLERSDPGARGTARMTER